MIMWMQGDGIMPKMDVFIVDVSPSSQIGVIHGSVYPRPIMMGNDALCWGNDVGDGFKAC